MQMSPTSQLLDDYNKNYQLDYWKRYTVDDNWALDDYSDEIKALAHAWLSQLQKQLFSMIVCKPRNYQVSEELRFLCLFRSFNENKRFLPKKMTKIHHDNLSTIDKFLIFRVFTRTMKTQIEQLADNFNEEYEDYQFSLSSQKKEKFPIDEEKKIKRKLLLLKLLGFTSSSSLHSDLNNRITLTARKID